MALDRQSIMRDDFPSNRRGYDPSAVDAHLDRIATEVEELRRQAATPAPAPPAPLSAQAGQQVKAIVEAAERGAQEIREAAHLVDLVGDPVEMGIDRRRVVAPAVAGEVVAHDGLPVERHGRLSLARSRRRLA